MRKNAIYARVDGIVGGQIPLEQVEDLSSEASNFEISKETFRGYVKTRLQQLHPSDSVEEIGRRCADLLPTKRVRRIYARIDDIDNGINFPQSVSKESLNLNISKSTFKNLYFKRIGLRHPELSAQKIDQLYQFNFKIKNIKIGEAKIQKIYNRVEAIQSGEIPPEQIRNMRQEAAAFNLHRNTFSKIVRGCFKKINPTLSRGEIDELMDALIPNEYFSSQSRIEAVYSRVAVVDKGDVPLEEVQSLREEAATFRLSSHQFRIHVKEELKRLHPELTKEEIADKCCFLFPTQRVRAIWTRVDEVDNGEVGMDDIKGIVDEAKKLNVQHIVFKRHALERLQRRHTELPPEKIEKYYQKLFNRDVVPVDKVSEIQNRGWAQYHATPESVSVPLSIIARDTGVNERTVAKLVQEEYRRRFREMGKTEEKGTEAFKETFPKDAHALAGDFNHIILEHGLQEVFDSQWSGPDAPQCSCETYEEGVRHDILIQGIQKGKWLPILLSKPAKKDQTFGELFGIAPAVAAQYNRIAIDFLPWDDKRRIANKVTKYATPRTLFFAVLTANGPKYSDHIGVVHGYPNARIISSEKLFSFLSAPAAAIEKVRKCGELTRRLQLPSLEAWAQQVKVGHAPRFTSGQYNLEVWLQGARDQLLLNQVQATAKKLLAQEIPPDIEKQEYRLRVSGRHDVASELAVSAALTRILQCHFNKQKSDVPSQLPLKLECEIKDPDRGLPDLPPDFPRNVPIPRHFLPNLPPDFPRHVEIPPVPKLVQPSKKACEKNIQISQEYASARECPERNKLKSQEAPHEQSSSVNRQESGESRRAHR